MTSLPRGAGPLVHRWRPPAPARADVAAIYGLVVLSLALFGPDLLGLSTFVGISDRLHNFLSMREFQVESLRELGRVPAWSDAMLLGIPVYGLHWMLLPFDPVGSLVALFPARDVFRVSGYVAAAHVSLGAIAAYLLIRDVVRSPFAAAVGAALYVCTTLPIQWISIVDPAFAILTLQPLGLLILRKVRRGRLTICFLGMTAIVAALAGFGLLQAVPYVLIFLGMYACYRLVSVPEWRSLVILGMASLVGILLTVPRLGTVVEDFRELSRSTAMQSTCPCELLRWFDEGIFGRYPLEALALGNTITSTRSSSFMRRRSPRSA